MLTFEPFDDERRAWLGEMVDTPPSGPASTTHRGRPSGLREDDVLDLVRAIHNSHAGPSASALHAVAELLIDHGERLAMWRQQHMLMDGRQIGRRPGTGGSEGMAYLDTTIVQRLYPILWEVRSVL